MRPPSRPSAARTSFSHASKLSVSSSCLSLALDSEKDEGHVQTYHLRVQLFQLRVLLVCAAERVICHGGVRDENRTDERRIISSTVRRGRKEVLDKVSGSGYREILLS